jgi:hypothetical protein
MNSPVSNSSFVTATEKSPDVIELEPLTMETLENEIPNTNTINTFINVNDNDKLLEQVGDLESSSPLIDERVTLSKPVLNVFGNISPNDTQQDEFGNISPNDREQDEFGNINNDLSNNDTQQDEFGDFEDEFHDFQDSIETKQITLEKELPNQIQTLSIIEDEFGEEIFRILPDSIKRLDFMCGFLNDLRIAFPLKLDELNLKCQILKQLPQDQNYNIKFNYFNSLHKKLFMESINKVNDEEPLSVTATTPSPHLNKSESEIRELEFEVANQLSSIPLIELESKSKVELQNLIQELTQSLQMLNEQLAYWIDTREKLVMDGEMHNKMIASLVSFAQQQQQNNKIRKSKK